MSNIKKAQAEIQSFIENKLLEISLGELLDLIPNLQDHLDYLTTKDGYDYLINKRQINKKGGK